MSHPVEASGLHTLPVSTHSTPPSGKAKFNSAIAIDAATGPPPKREHDLQKQFSDYMQKNSTIQACVADTTSSDPPAKRQTPSLLLRENSGHFSEDQFKALMSKRAEATAAHCLEATGRVQPKGWKEHQAKKQLEKGKPHH
eukprot:Selendium_serpulae@DN6214_c0_g1_i12.p1